MMRKVKCLILRFGHVETSSLAIVPFIHNGDGFDTVGEALRSLGEGLYNWFYRDEVSSRWCCRAELKKDPNTLACSRCKRKMNEKLDFNMFEQLIVDIPRMTADGGPSEDVIGWRPWVSMKEVFAIAENTVEITGDAAELIITAIDPNLLPELDMSTYYRWDAFFAQYDLGFNNHHWLIENP